MQSMKHTLVATPGQSWLNQQPLTSGVVYTGNTSNANYVQELLEAAKGQPDPRVKQTYFDAANAALTAAEVARRRDIDTLNAEIGDETFLLPHDHYKWITALHDRDTDGRRSILNSLESIKALLIRQTRGGMPK